MYDIVLMPREFLSTLSLRRATGCVRYCTHAPGISIHALLAESDQIFDDISGATEHFYPRSPCGERRRNGQNIKRRHRISIHALLAESDPEKSESLTTYFISIHALLAESDRLWTILYSCPGNFYPRSPCGERPNQDF